MYMYYRDSHCSVAQMRQDTLNVCMYITIVHAHIRTHTHTHKRDTQNGRTLQRSICTYYICMYVCICMCAYVCVCVCVCVLQRRAWQQAIH